MGMIRILIIIYLLFFYLKCLGECIYNNQIKFDSQALGFKHDTGLTILKYIYLYNTTIQAIYIAFNWNKDRQND